MAIRINGVKSSHLSDDKKEIVVAAMGKYIGEIELRFACECVDELVKALAAAKSVLEPASPVAATPAGGDNFPGRPPAASASRNPNEVTFEIPRNFSIAADPNGRGLVLFIVNHKLERQAGYALTPDAAKQVAGGLVKSADALLSAKAPATKN